MCALMTAAGSFDANLVVLCLTNPVDSIAYLSIGGLIVVAVSGIISLTSHNKTPLKLDKNPGYVTMCRKPWKDVWIGLK